MIRRLALILALGVAALAGAARAQCVSVDTATLSAPYNPFGTSGGIDQVVTLKVRRDSSIINTVSDADLVFVRRSGDNLPYDMVVVSDDGGSGGTRVLYSPPGPNINLFGNNAGEIDMNYGTFLSPDVRNAQIRFTLPVSTDLPAGTYEAVFDVKFGCNATLGQTFGTTPSGFRLRFDVLSALQASFVGSALDFGDVSGLSASDVATAPDTVKRQVGNLRVASSGPYTLNVRSQNGWYMTAGGGATQVANQRIAYELTLAGGTAQAGQEYQPRTCARAGVAATYVAIAATLRDGGVGKVANSLYQDVVTVTLTPLGAGQAPGAGVCQ